MKTAAIYETERLLLRPTDQTDAAFLLELLNTEKWLKNIGDRNVHHLEDAENYISQRMTPQFERLGFGNYTIITKENQQKVGICGLYERPHLQDIDLGFALLPQFEGKGFAYEAVMRIKVLAFEELDLPKLLAITLPDNKESQKLLLKIGFHYQQLIRLQEDAVDLSLYMCVKG